MTYPAQKTSPSPGGSPWRLPQLRHRVAIPVVVLLLVATVGNLLVLTPQVTVGETALLEGLTHYRNAFFDVLASAIQFGLSNLMILVIIAVISTWLVLARKAPLDAAGFVIVALSGWGAVGVVKAAVHRPRPSLGDGQALLELQGATSFPSGHTGAAIAITLALALVMYRARVRNRILLVGGVLAVLVALSRVYAAAHFPLDVMFSLPTAWAGVMLGCTLANKLVPALAFGFTWQQDGVVVPVPARVQAARIRKAEAKDENFLGVHSEDLADHHERSERAASAAGPINNGSSSVARRSNEGRAPREVAFDQDQTHINRAA